MGDESCEIGPLESTLIFEPFVSPYSCFTELTLGLNRLLTTFSIAATESTGLLLNFYLPFI